MRSKAMVCVSVHRRLLWVSVVLVSVLLLLSVTLVALRGRSSVAPALFEPVLALGLELAFECRLTEKPE